MRGFVVLALLMGIAAAVLFARRAMHQAPGTISIVAPADSGELEARGGALWTHSALVTENASALHDGLVFDGEPPSLVSYRPIPYGMLRVREHNVAFDPLGLTLRNLTLRAFSLGIIGDFEGPRLDAQGSRFSATRFHVLSDLTVSWGWVRLDGDRDAVSLSSASISLVAATAGGRVGLLVAPGASVGGGNFGLIEPSDVQKFLRRP